MNPSDQPDKPITEHPQAAGRAVLCIEDEHFIGELYARALTKSGYRTTVVTDGKEGLDAAETDQYDIILLDLMLPNVTGIEILRKLRDPARPTPIRAKIIITTNLEQRDDIKADIEKQADGYLVKAELTPHELVNFLDRVK